MVFLNTDIGFVARGSCPLISERTLHIYNTITQHLVGEGIEVAIASILVQVMRALTGTAVQCAYCANGVV